MLFIVLCNMFRLVNSGAKLRTMGYKNLQEL